MNTPNKLIFIITTSLAGIILATACSKESKAPEGQKEGGKTPVASNASNKSSQGKDTLNAIRNGQYVNLNWQIDATGMDIKQISIIRSSTGPNNQKKVAVLEPETTSYKDCLPDENAYWYWIQLSMPGGKFQKFGPVRVGRDAAGSANYIKSEDKYKISIVRTDDFATLKWDFPEGGYKEIRILRYTRPVAELLDKLTKTKEGEKEGPLVTVTVEGKSKYTDALPDANSDYWYWFHITLKSGAIIDRGPIKAVYISQ